MNKEPVIGNWYKSPEIPSIFEVVAYSEPDCCYEIQLFDGEISELDEDTWKDMLIREIVHPSDWSGALELPTEELLEYLGYYHHSDILDFDISDRIDENFLQ